MPLDEITAADENPRDHEVEEIAASIRRFGFTDAPILDERTSKLIGGHGRIKALAWMRAQGDPEPDGVGKGWAVPVQRGWSSENDAEAEAMLVAINRLTERARWRTPALTEMLNRIRSTPLGLDGVGYDSPTLDQMMEQVRVATVREHERQLAGDDDAEDRITVPDEPVTRPGDVWQIGPHRLICGDCRDPEVWTRLLAGTTVNLAVTSPPYADRRTYDEASGFKPIHPDGYVAWFMPLAANVAAHLAADGSWLVNIKAGADGLDRERYVLELVLAHLDAGWHWADEFCWERHGIPGRPSRRLKNQWEPVHHFARGDWKFRPDAVRHASNSVPLYLPDANLVFERLQGQPGELDFGNARRPRANSSTKPMTEMQGTGADVGAAVIEGLAYPGNRLPTFAGTHEATGHTAAYPVGLPEFFVKLLTDPGDAVIDPFMGSGSTMLAAHRQGRVGYGIELSPAYCDVIVERMRRRANIEGAKVK